MFKEYDSIRWDGEIVTKARLEECTGVDFGTLALFTGLVGTDRNSGLLTPDEIYVFNYFPHIGLYHPVNVGDHQTVVLATFYLDLKNLTITNHKVNLRNRGNGIGLEAHKRQVKIACEYGFKNMFVTAYGGVDDTSEAKEFIGHWVCAKFGYTMRPKSLEKFRKKIGKKYPGITKVQDLFDVPGGEDYWRVEGWTWSGIFDLTPGSINHNLLEKYLQSQ